MNKRKPLAILLVTLLLGVFILSAATPALAVCSGTDCNGKDPQATGCSSGAYNVSSQTYNGPNGSSYLVELRWSPTCQTNWVRLTNKSSGYRYMKAYMLQSGVPGELYPTYKSGGTNFYYWTPMKFAPTGKIYISGCGGGSPYPNSGWDAGNCSGYYVRPVD
jgi:hypothetical protein